MPADYNSTILLPKTEFSMKAGLTKKEPEARKRWDDSKLYERIQEAGKGRPQYILHDGPPYANGDIHMGTALNKVLKDIIVRYKTMNGFHSPYVPGWDTHGLPIELKAIEGIKKKGKISTDITKLELRALCRDFAMRYVDAQREQFKRLGVLGDFDNAYMTLTPDFEARQIKVFGEMVKKGYIYKGKKAVYWCPNDKTALAEAEIEYDEEPCTSIYVAFAVQEDNGALTKLGVDSKDVSFVIWTTTAWTLPGNVAICLGSEFDYALVECGGKKFVIAEALVEDAMQAAGITEYKTVATVSGAELEGIECQHPFLDRQSRVILGDHVTLESGTGCVHTAPGHGVEDFEVCTKFYPDIPVIVPVNESGVLTEEAGRFGGMHTSKGSKAIIEYLAESGHLFAKKEIMHQYPHCWRCKHPILFRTTEQWFCSVEAYKEEVYSAIEQVTFTPSWGKERLTGMVRDRNDWCISRQRTWGVPIPAFYCDSCGKYHIDESSIDAVSELFKNEGSDAWYIHEAKDILPSGTKCTECGCEKFEKETDIMDVWFDSGTTHTMLTELKEHRWPADLYLEGGDQFRGWFQSSLLTAVPYLGSAPYKAVLTNGWVVDGEGRKMSKSLGNGILANEVVEQYGADILRLWVASSDYQVDIRVSKDILKQLTETYRKIRNTARFILGNLSDYNPSTDRVKAADMLPIDRYILARLNNLIAVCTEAYDTFEFHTATHAIHQFCVVELSNFYLDIIKDRLYCDGASGQSRRSAQTVMETLLSAITRMLAPTLTYTADEVWQHLGEITGEKGDLALASFPKQDDEFNMTEDETNYWKSIVEIRDIVSKSLENARTEKIIGSSLEAAVELSLATNLYNVFSADAKQLQDILIVSQLKLVDGGDQALPNAVISKASGEKCMRCWCYTEQPVHDGDGVLCGRCDGLVNE